MGVIVWRIMGVIMVCSKGRSKWRSESGMVCNMGRSMDRRESIRGRNMDRSEMQARANAQAATGHWGKTRLEERRCAVSYGRIDEIAEKAQILVDLYNLQVVMHMIGEDANIARGVMDRVFADWTSFDQCPVGALIRYAYASRSEHDADLFPVNVEL